MDIFLGEPPVDIKQWIIEHSSSTSHTYTRFAFQNGTYEDYEINGSLNNEFMIERGWYDDVVMAWNVNIISIDIGSTVNFIDNYTFFHCEQLENIIIPPNSISSIGECAFQSCYKLTSIEIPNGVINIDNNAFTLCNRLKNVTIGNSVTSIGDVAFYTETGSISSMTFLGKTLSQVQAMSNYPWGIEDTSVINVA